MFALLSRLLLGMLRRRYHRREVLGIPDAALLRLHSCAVWWADHPPPEGWGLPHLPASSRWDFRLREQPVLDQVDGLAEEMRRRGLAPLAPHPDGQPDVAPPPASY